MRTVFNQNYAEINQCDVFFFFYIMYMYFPVTWGIIVQAGMVIPVCIKIACVFFLSIYLLLLCMGRATRWSSLFTFTESSCCIMWTSPHGCKHNSIAACKECTLSSCSRKMRFWRNSLNSILYLTFIWNCFWLIKSSLIQ